MNCLLTMEKEANANPELMQTDKTKLNIGRQTQSQPGLTTATTYV